MKLFVNKSWDYNFNALAIIVANTIDEVPGLFEDLMKDVEPSFDNYDYYNNREIFPQLNWEEVPEVTVECKAPRIVEYNYSIR